MAKAQKFPRTIVRASGREAGGSSNARARHETQRVGDDSDALARDPPELVRRLAELCKKPSPADSSLRAERIATIQRAIKAGTYRISAADIAEKLIGHMLVNRPSRT